MKLNGFSKKKSQMKKCALRINYWALSLKKFPKQLFFLYAVSLPYKTTHNYGFSLLNNLILILDVFFKLCVFLLQKNNN